MNDDLIERQRRHFDSIAERYEISRAHPNHRRLKDLIWSEALSCGAALPEGPLRVLEPMCGFADGHDILSRALDQGIHYTGFDYSAEVIDRLQRKRKDLKSFVADVSKFESEAQWDIIILLGGLHHVPHIAADAVQRLSNSLAPGGLFINFEPTHGNPLTRRIRERIYAKNELFDEQTERAFAVEELLGFFRSAGLDHVNTIWPGLLAYVLYYNPDAFPALNRGSVKTLERLWSLERPFVATRLARAVSFATLTIWQAPSP